MAGEKEWSVVAEFTNHPEAELTGDLLRKHGIDAAIWSDDCGGIAGGQTFIQRVRVLVPDSELQAARAIVGKGQEDD